MQMGKDKIDGNRIDRLAIQARNDLQSVSAELAEYQAKRADWLLIRIGDNATLMANSLDQTKRGLHSCDPKHRIAALLVLAEYWQPDHESLLQTEEIAFNDADQTVRGFGIYVLTRLILMISSEAKNVICAAFQRRSVETQNVEALGNASGVLGSVRSSVASRMKEEFLFSLCGPLLGAFRSRKELAQEFLAHQMPNLRMAALIVLTEHHLVDERTRTSCEEMARGDSDLEVRHVAISCLGRLYRYTDNARIGEFYANLVRDAGCPMPLRRAAYLNLYFLRPRNVRSSPILKIVKRGFRFPEEVDWSFVDSFGS
jgi:hypothetical protein